MKNNKFLELKLSEAAELIKNVTIDEKIKTEFINFIDKFGKSSTVLIKEVLHVMSTNVADALSNALDRKINGVKQIVEGVDINVRTSEDNGSDIRRKNT